MKALKAKRPEAKAIILTGYGAIATAVVAVKLGAYDYLAKPVNADEIVAVLTAERGQHVDGPEHPMSADRVRWEHIQRVYESCERNVSDPRRSTNARSDARFGAPRVRRQRFRALRLAWRLRRDPGWGRPVPCAVSPGWERTTG